MDHLDPIFASLAPGWATFRARPGAEGGRDPRAERGYIHAGPSGAGHFVKMIHNGIEYGMMQAFAEGFDILQEQGVRVLARGRALRCSISRTSPRFGGAAAWSLPGFSTLARDALVRDASLSKFTGDVADSGEGRWTIEAAIEEAVPAEVLSAALYRPLPLAPRAHLRRKLLSAMRFGFGGHVEPERR